MTVENRAATIPEAWEEAARGAAERPAFTSGGQGGRRVTWSALHREIVDFAAGLIALGLEPGDRLAIVAENSIEWVVACVAALKAGAIVVPVYHELKPPEIAEQVGWTECRFVVASGRMLAAIPASSPGLKHVIVIEDGAGPGLGTPGGFAAMAFAQVSAAATSESRAALPARAPAPDDVAAVIFTSGTTGGAKGVMLSHRNFMANGYSVLGALTIRSDDSVLLVLPLHHAMPFIVAIVLLPLRGARAVIENDLRRLRDRLMAERVTIFFGVPALYELMYRNFLTRAEAEGRLDAFQAWQKRVLAIKRATGVNIGPLVFRQVHQALGGRLRFLVSGGAALKAETARSFFSLGLPLIQGWGMTEAAPAVALQRFSVPRFRFTRYYEKHAGSVGAAVPGVEVRLADVAEKKIEVASQGEGEVEVRGNNVFRGYWRAPAETALAMSGEWLRSGDLARVDSDGSIYLTGRSKYIIVLDSGEKVHPDELEEKLSESPILQDVCVIGRRERDKTQVGAIVYPHVEATLAALLARREPASGETVKQIVRAEIDRLARELAAYKRVTEIILTDAPLPKTPLLKIARGQLPEEYEFSLERWLQSGDEATL